MKFYVISCPANGTVACETTRVKAFKELLSWNAGKWQSARAQGYAIDLVQIDITPREAIRRLLGNIGGYASSTTRVWPPEPKTVQS